MPLRTTLAAVVLVASAASLHRAPNPELDAATIVHVAVVDVATGKELPDQTVVLEGDHIVSVQAFDPTAARPQGRLVDARGAFLIPGLWDMHVHIQDLEDLPLYIANGVTGVRLMFGSKKTKELRARFASAPVAPDILVGSAIVDGDPIVWPGSIVIHKPGDARRVVDEVKESGADFVKIYDGIPRDAFLRWPTKPANRAFRLPAIYPLKSALRKPLTPASAPSSISQASPSPAPAASKT